jgi:hypothetical protein
MTISLRHAFNGFKPPWQIAMGVFFQMMPAQSSKLWPA